MSSQGAVRNAPNTGRHTELAPDEGVPVRDEKRASRVHAAISSFSAGERARIDSLLDSCGVAPAERDGYLRDLLGLMEAVLDGWDAERRQ